MRGMKAFDRCRSRQAQCNRLGTVHADYAAGAVANGLDLLLECDHCQRDRLGRLEQDLPGARTREHPHPAFIVYAAAPFKRRLTLGDGRVLTREFKAGDVIYSNGETHIGENVGETPTRVIMVEIKAVAP
jgi:hypothetical protein